MLGNYWNKPLKKPLSLGLPGQQNRVRRNSCFSSFVSSPPPRRTVQVFISFLEKKIRRKCEKSAIDGMKVLLWVFNSKRHKSLNTFHNPLKYFNFKVPESQGFELLISVVVFPFSCAFSQWGNWVLEFSFNISLCTSHLFFINFIQFSVSLPLVS